jgi:hypothetical protein
MTTLHGYTPAVLQSDVPAVCPEWCIVGEHTGERCTEDVRHIGAMLQPLEADLDRGAEPARLLSVECISWSNEDGTPGAPRALLQPYPDVEEDNDAELDPDGLRAVARRVLVHAAAMETMADKLERLQREE